MADFSYDAFDDAAAGLPGGLAGANRLKRLTNKAGAAVSVALVVGLAVWGYQLAVRAARGVPVVQAEAGPMRVAPDDPGGAQMAHQGLAVNNVAAVGEVAAPADRLMLAPAPVELTDTDQAGFAPMPLSAVVPTLTPTIPAPAALMDEGTSTGVLEGDAALIDMEPDTTLPDAAQPDAALSDDAQMSATQAAIVPDAAANAAPPSMTSETDAAGIQAAVQAAVLDAALDAAPATDPAALLSATAAAVATSPRPPARPSAVAAQQATTLAASTSTAPIDASTLASGTRLVQLGAYDEPAAATTDWSRLVGAYAVYFEGKRPVIQKAVSGGKTFYRLRAMGFEDEDASRRFCAVLLNDNAQCIPVLTR